MKRSRISVIAWTLSAFVLALVILSSYLNYRPPHAVVSAFDVVRDLSIAVFLLLCAVMAALIISSQPGNPIGWLLMFIAVSISATILLGYFFDELVSSPSTPAPVLYLLFWFDSLSWWLAMGPLLLVLLLFPNGKPPSPRWRWVIYLLGFCFILFVFIATFSANMISLSGSGTYPNPIGWLSAEAVNWLVIPMQIVMAGCAIMCGAAVLFRFRRAQMVERAQIKWLLFACAIFLVVLFTNGYFVQEGSYWGISFNLAIIGIPAAIGVAILRYHLWDIDLIIRRSLLYALLSGFLGLVYFGSVVLLRQVLGGVTGDSSPALVVSTLLIAALFNPLRRQIQARIDLRFYRRKYNAEQALLQFAAAARQETELDALAAQLTRTVQENMQPVSIGLWLSAQHKDKSR